jgi:hypothetical protein
LASLNMPSASDHQVNEKPFKTGINSQNPPVFYPLSWEKTAYSILSDGPSIAKHFHCSGEERYARLFPFDVSDECVDLGLGVSHGATAGTPFSRGLFECRGRQAHRIEPVKAGGARQLVSEGLELFQC